MEGQKNQNVCFDKNIETINETNIITNFALIDQIDKILNEYLYKIETLQNDIKTEDIIGAIYVYAEIYEYFTDKDKWDQIINMQLIRLKECIEEDTVLHGAALFGGLCEVGLSVYLYSKKTGHYYNFWENIHEIIVDMTREMVKDAAMKINDLHVYQYDCVRGLSGILNYLIHVDEEHQNKELIEDILGYLIQLSKRKMVNGKMVPGWHIPCENQIREEEKQRFRNGNFDFGMAHGIAGPLAAMSLAYQKGYCVEGQKEAIVSIADEYNRLALRFKDCTYWQGQYSFEDYFESNQDTAVYKNKMSWCYGPLGISRTLKLAGYALESQTRIEQEENHMSQIASMESRCYFLDSPIICHGYAGMMALLTLEYKEHHNDTISLKIIEMAEQIVKEYDPDYIFGFKHTETFYQNGTALKSDLFGNEFLYGASGVILSLISMMKKETSWEIHLLAK